MGCARHFERSAQRARSRETHEVGFWLYKTVTTRSHPRGCLDCARSARGVYPELDSGLDMTESATRLLAQDDKLTAQTMVKSVNKDHSTLGSQLL